MENSNLGSILGGLLTGESVPTVEFKITFDPLTTLSLGVMLFVAIFLAMFLVKKL